MSAWRTVISGVPGFFSPHVPGPWLRPCGTREALGYYTTNQLRSTLERLVDFDRINAGPCRFSVGAVNVRTGNFIYFDTKTHHIAVDHVMASGALPPGFPPVEINGEFYWDGGLVSNTPLQWVVDNDTRHDNLIFQVDLWGAQGDIPANMPDVMARQKAIQYSSRTRAQTDQLRRLQALRRGLADYLDKLPDVYRQGPEFESLQGFADQTCFNVIHLIYQAQNYEGQAKDMSSPDSAWRTIGGSATTMPFVRSATRKCWNDMTRWKKSLPSISPAMVATNAMPPHDGRCR